MVNLFQGLARRYNTPLKVQGLLRTLQYNDDKKDTVHSALRAWELRNVHCLESTFLAAAILEHCGYPPLAMSLESIDALDHVVYIFKAKNGWGSIGRSREEGLHGRAPVFRSVRDLAWSYVDPYVDLTGRVTAFGYANLDESQSPWRDSRRNVWKAEKFLIDLRHKKIKTSKNRYQSALKRYQREGHKPESFWW